jgi:hypothetical protein
MQNNKVKNKRKVPCSISLIINHQLAFNNRKLIKNTKYLFSLNMGKVISKKNKKIIKVLIILHLSF